ncbi:glycosyltransferase [Candidatus Woesearchaeota archaeon]|nr:glycosyltransferase [Candidatus Woesearchaeota archaeon]
MTFKEAVDYFFVQYNSWGRPFLDWLHWIFNSVFEALLVVAVVLSLVYVLMSLYIFFARRNWKSAPVGGDKLPFVSINLPTYNESVVISCAQKCLELDYPQDRYEVIIGDDSSDRSVSDRIDAFAAQHPQVKVCRRPDNSGYKAGNLNNMLKVSRGEILVLFDSDFAPSRDFLRYVVAPFMRDRRVGGVQAKWRFVNAEQNLVSALGATIVEVFQSITLPFMFRNRKLAFLCGSAEAVRKDILVSLGGWDHGNLTEDIEYSLRLIRNGYRIEYLYDVKCDSEVPYVARDLYRQQMRWAYGVVSSYIKHAGGIFRSRKIGFADKFMTTMLCSGYLLTILLASLFLTGFLSVITHPPAPVDFVRFFEETGRNTLLTSGLVIASVVACLISSVDLRRLSFIFKMLISSFSYGLIVAYHVNLGVFKALLGRPMKWYMLTKSGS